MKTDYTREDLIGICERAIVPQEKWSDRDSHHAHEGIGESWALLKAGCKFKVCTKENQPKGDSCVTDEETIWLEIYVRDFNYFESEHEDRKENMNTHFLPTPERLAKANGEDWY